MPKRVLYVWWREKNTKDWLTQWYVSVAWHNMVVHFEMKSQLYVQRSTMYIIHVCVCTSYCLFRQMKKRVVLRHWQIANKMNRQRGTPREQCQRELDNVGNEHTALYTTIQLKHSCYTLNISSSRYYIKTRLFAQMDVHNTIADSSIL